MNKSHIEIFTEYFKDLQEKLLEQEKELSELFDKIIVWIIGLSTGSIVLIFSSIDKISFVNKQTIDNTITLLVLTIISGILGRVLFAIARYISYSQAANFYSELRLLEFPHNPRKLEGNETSEMIYYFILEDFKTELPILLSKKEKVTNDKWAEIDKEARDFYVEYSKVNLSSINNAIDEISKSMITSFGLKKNHFKRKKNNYNRFKGVVNRSFVAVSRFSYILSVCVFAIALLYISTKYLGHHNLH